MRETAGHVERNKANGMSINQQLRAYNKIGTGGLPLTFLRHYVLRSKRKTGQG